MSAGLHCALSQQMSHLFVGMFVSYLY